MLHVDHPPQSLYTHTAWFTFVRLLTLLYDTFACFCCIQMDSTPLRGPRLERTTWQCSVTPISRTVMKPSGWLRTVWTVLNLARLYVLQSSSYERYAFKKENVVLQFQSRSRWCKRCVWEGQSGSLHYTVVYPLAILRQGKSYRHLWHAGGATITSCACMNIIITFLCLYESTVDLDLKRTFPEDASFLRERKNQITAIVRNPADAEKHMLKNVVKIPTKSALVNCLWKWVGPVYAFKHPCTTELFFSAFSIASMYMGHYGK